MNPLQTILTLINQKQYPEGKQAATTLINRNKGGRHHPILLRLRATCCFALQEYKQAIDDLQQACTLGMKDGEIYVNLAKVYFFIGEIPKAFNNISKALTYKDRFYSQAVTFLHKSLLSQLHESELSVLSDYLNAELVIGDQAKNALANVFLAQEKVDEAMQVLSSVESPGSADIEMTLAVAQRLKGDSQEAVTRLLSVKEKFGSHHAIFHQLGNCYSDLGELSTACNHYEAAITLNDQYRFSHSNLAELLYQQGLADSMLTSYELLDSKKRFNLYTFKDYLQFLIRLNAHDKVLNLLELYEVQFQSRSLLYFRAEAERLCGNDQKALQIIKAIEPELLTNDELCQLAQHLISTNDYSLAQAYLDRVLTQDKFNQWAFSLYFLMSKNSLASSPQTLQYEDYIFEYKIKAPESYDSIEDYLIALSKRLFLMHSVSENSPLNLTIQGGTQTQANLFAVKDPLIAHLSSEFHRCVNQTLTELTNKKVLHTGFHRQGRTHCSGSWSINTKEDGNHSNHIHPMGLVSSVCYISLPGCISNDNGALQFGVPPFETSFKPQRIKYTPRNGALFIFPSCFWHGTTPLRGGDNRLTVAADFVIKNKLSVSNI